MLEPTYTAAYERYLDLTRFYDVAAAQAARAEIVAHSDAYRAAYAEAYRILRAAEAIAAERRAAVRAAVDGRRLAARFDGVIRRELRGKKGARGRIDRAFLGGLTHKGELCRYDTADALCPRVYELCDSFGIASGELERLCGAAADAGFDVLACMDPDFPREIAHALIPRLGVAFVTSPERLPYPGEAYRRLRLDATARAKLSGAEKAKLRFTGRIERTLRDEAAEALRRAKREHDRLEEVYNPCVDFSGVYALAAEEARRLAGCAEAREGE